MNQLAEKVDYLRSNWLPRRIIGHRDSYNAFCASIKVPNNTLKGCLDSGGMGLDLQAEFAAACGFEASWREWLDPTAAPPEDDTTPPEKRRDSAASFAQRYERENRARAAARATAKRPTAGQAATPTALAVPVPLVEDTSTRPNSMVTELASVALHLRDSNPEPGEVGLKFSLNCSENSGDGGVTSVKFGYLEFDCGTGRTCEARGRTGFPDGIVIDGARLAIGSVLTDQPSWAVAATTEKAIGLVASAPVDFIIVRNLSPGRIVSVSFKACVRDIEATFVIPSNAEPSEAKKKIKKRLRSLDITDGEDGYALLASTMMRFVAAGESAYCTSERKEAPCQRKSK